MLAGEEAVFGGSAVGYEHGGGAWVLGGCSVWGAELDPAGEEEDSGGFGEDVLVEGGGVCSGEGEGDGVVMGGALLEPFPEGASVGRVAEDEAVPGLGEAVVLDGEHFSRGRPGLWDAGAGIQVEGSYGLQEPLRGDPGVGGVTAGVGWVVEHGGVVGRSPYRAGISWVLGAGELKDADEVVELGDWPAFTLFEVGDADPGEGGGVTVDRDDADVDSGFAVFNYVTGSEDF